MKKRFLFLGTVVIFIGLSTTSIGAEVLIAEGIKDVEPEIKSYLANRAVEVDEFKKAVPYISHLVRGDIDGDKKDDVFVSYAIEGIGGGNFSLLFQTLFINEKGKLVFKAERDNGSFGTAQGKSLIPIRIEKGSVLCESLAYAPGDAVCCPSINGKAQLFFENGKLIEKEL